MPEGATIPEANPATSETVIHTGRGSILCKVSTEQSATGDTPTLMSDSIRRSLLRKSNQAFLAQVAPTSPATTPPAGLLALNPTVGGTLSSDLDALTDAIGTIEAAWGTATTIIASPSAWASLSRMKVGTDFNSTLLGAGTLAATRALSGLPVVVSPSMTAGKVLVLDKTAVLVAAGEVMVAVSDQYFFSSSSLAIRATFRFGQKLMDPARAVVLTVA